MNKSLRVHTGIHSNDNIHINLEMEQNFDILEILSLKISKDNIGYLTHSSDYGCVAGRVLANGGFGVPNAKISIFIERDKETKEDKILSNLYPYKSTTLTDNGSVRYNLLPESGGDNCFQPVGTFPIKRMVLDDNNVLDIFEKYYKFTTRTNNSGDYILFGVPVGTQTLHCDVDISDCGILSQKPRDLAAKGYNMSQFDSPNQFKKSENLDSLPQIYSSNESVDVLPYWGDESENALAITRKDITVNYTFEPTCVFLGSIFTDNNDNGISQECVPSDEMGVMSNLITTTGTIEMIRKTMDDTVEEYQVNATDLIDANGTWCYQIPMNLDYVTMDEYGNIVPTDDPSKGIPTRARVRFRISLTDNGEDYSENHFVKMLVPNNPKTQEDLDYVFGTDTLDDEYGTKSFRDLFWNKVYTVKTYIPRIQQGNGDDETRFTGIKSINNDLVNNPMPYNNMRVNQNKAYKRECNNINRTIKWAYVVNKYFGGAVAVGDGMCPELENWYFVPGAKNLQRTYERVRESINDTKDEKDLSYENGEDSEICVTNNINYFLKCVNTELAREHNVINFDFYNDWINGAIYIPRWFANVKKKKSYLFGLIKVEPKLEACLEENGYDGYRLLVQQCALEYDYDSANNTYTKVVTPTGCKSESKQQCHLKGGRKNASILRRKGGIHRQKTFKGQSVYYFRPFEWVSENGSTKRLPLFATDIVLLGTFNDNDQDGIKETLTSLKPTSYSLPSSIAETNMNVEGFMFGHETGHLCKNTTESGIIKYDDTFSAYKKWASKQDLLTEADSLTNEYGVTVSAGIDWNYLGPNQKGNFKPAVYYPGGHFVGLTCGGAESNIKSCVNLSRICEIGVIPSRRRGVLINKGDNYGWAYIVPNGIVSKEEIVDEQFRVLFATMNGNGLRTTRDENSGRLKYDLTYLNPRNFSGELRHKINSYPQYYNIHVGPDDSENKSLNNYQAYNRVVEQTSEDYYYFRLGVDTRENINRTLLMNKYIIVNGNRVSMPLYENSFYFYFGLKKGYTAIDRFFQNYYATCPDKNAYNSYFTVSAVSDIEYCSRNTGTTDAEVKIYDLDGPYLIYLYKDELSQKLEVNSDGDIIVDNSYGKNDFAEINKRRIFIRNLPIGQYTIVIGGVNSSSIERNFEIKYKLPELVTEIAKEVESYDFASGLTSDYGIKPFYSFQQEKVNYRDNKWEFKIIEYKDPSGVTINKEGFWLSGTEGHKRTEIGGYIKIPTVEGEEQYKGTLIIASDGFKAEPSVCDLGINWDDEALTHGKQKYEWMDMSIGGEKTPTAWEGNVDYIIYAVWECQEGKYDFIPMNKRYISMDSGPDVYVGNESITYRKLMQYRAEHSPRQAYRTGWRWWLSELIGYKLSDGAPQYLNDDDKRWLFKRAIWFSGSFYNRERGRLIAGFMNREDSPKSQISGYGEKEAYESTKGVNTITLKYMENGEDTDESGFTIDMSNIKVPNYNETYLEPKDYTTGTNVTGEDGKSVEKLDYYFNFNTKEYISKEGKWEYGVSLASVYRPFYANVFFIRVNSGTEKGFWDDIYIRIANGISYGQNAPSGRFPKALDEVKWRIGDSVNAYVKSGTITPTPKDIMAFGNYGEVNDIDFGDNLIKTDKGLGKLYYPENLVGVTFSGATLEEYFGYSNEYAHYSGSTDAYLNGAVEVSDAPNAAYGVNLPNETTSVSFSLRFLEKNNPLQCEGVRYYKVVEKNLDPFTICSYYNDDYPYDEKKYHLINYVIDYSHVYDTVKPNSTYDKSYEDYIREEHTGSMPAMHGWYCYVNKKTKRLLPQYFQGIFTYLYKGKGGYSNLKKNYMLEEIDINTADIDDLLEYKCIGLYDDWTKLPEDEYNEVYKNRGDRRFTYVPKHTSSICAVRSYAYSLKDGVYDNEFIDILRLYRGENSFIITFDELMYHDTFPDYSRVFEGMTIRDSLNIGYVKLTFKSLYGIIDKYGEKTDYESTPFETTLYSDVMQREGDSILHIDSIYYGIDGEYTYKKEIVITGKTEYKITCKMYYHFTKGVTEGERKYIEFTILEQ